jgi:hypothetical protein
MGEAQETRLPAAWQPKAPRTVGRRRYLRYVVRTHLIQPGERLQETLLPYLAGYVGPGDIVAIGEKAVAIAEGRAIPLAEIRPRPLARFLSARVRSLGYGLGLRRPETMEMALREGGTPRILLAAAVAAATRLMGRSGDFYRIAGRRVAAIDGPGPATIPPFDRYVVLAPLCGQELAERLAFKLKAKVAVVDVNFVGSEVLAASPGVDAALVQELLRDNPMGQGPEQTPVVVLRPVRRVSSP